MAWLHTAYYDTKNKKYILYKPRCYLSVCFIVFISAKRGSLGLESPRTHLPPCVLFRYNTKLYIVVRGDIEPIPKGILLYCVIKWSKIINTNSLASWRLSILRCMVREKEEEMRWTNKLTRPNSGLDPWIPFTSALCPGDARDVTRP